MMTLQQQLEKQLQELDPQHLEILNESAGHGGYYSGKESHFKVIIVGDIFKGRRLVQRHQQVYSQVNHLLAAGGGQIHALAIHAYTPDEWQGEAPASPNCAHAPKVKVIFNG